MIYTIYSNKSATLQEEFPTRNNGLDEVMFLERKDSPDYTSRMIIHFPLDNNEFHYRGINLNGTNYTSSLKLFSTQANSNIIEGETIRCETIIGTAESSSWVAGTGRSHDTPTTETDVSWTNRKAGNVTWSDASGNPTPGGYSTLLSDDAKTTITKLGDISFAVSSSTVLSLNPNGNIGFIIKLENSSSNEPTKLSYFSTNTHTIYQPRLEFAWDDSTYVTGSNYVVVDQPFDSNDYYCYLKDNAGSYQYNTLVKFNVKLRPKYEPKTYSNVAAATKTYVLAQNRMTYAIIDAKTNEYIIDHSLNTKLSCDATNGYFFNLWTSNLSQERNYIIEIQENMLAPGLPDDMQKQFSWRLRDTFKITR